MLVVGLPQRVAAPPSADVFVDHRHEVHRFARGLALLDEERNIGRMQQHGGGIGVALHQGRDGPVRLVGRLGGVEECVDRTAVQRMQSGLGALQHCREAVSPSDVQPVAAITHRQFDVALQPLQVCHVGDITEVRLGSERHRGDDLPAPRRHRLAITGDVVEQPAATRCGVVDFVNVGAELATPGRHAAVGFSGTDPLVGTGRVDQELLDRV